MQITMAGVCTLRDLRKVLQQDAGDDYPNHFLNELLLLYDVCKCLDMTVGHRMDVIGEQGWDLIHEHLNSRVFLGPNNDNCSCHT